jgi:OFA family oxalate/formate antiporter-like MFS transporter
MILAGRFVDRGHAKEALMAGGSLFGLGFVIVSFIPSLTVLYLGYGVIGGVGISYAYAGALGNAPRYFPDRKGVATGLVTAGNGAAAVITAPLLGVLISHYGVLVALRFLGVGFLVISMLSELTTKSAPTDFRPEGWSPPAVRKSGSDLSVDWRGMVVTPTFYLLLGLLAAGALSGLMIAANASQIGQRMFALSATSAAVYVGMYVASNAAGRFISRIISDKIGRPNSLIVIFTLVALMLLLLTISSSAAVFALGISGIGLSFGGVMGVFPSIVSERFGTKFFGVDYGIMFAGYSIAAFLGPRLAASIGSNNNGDFSKAFYIAIMVCLGGIVMSVLLRHLSRRVAATS